MIIEFFGIALGFPICVYQNNGAWVNQFAFKSIQKCLTIGKNEQGWVGLTLLRINNLILFQ